MLKPMTTAKIKLEDENLTFFVKGNMGERIKLKMRDRGRDEETDTITE